MGSVSTRTADYLRTWFDDVNQPAAYVEGCENAPRWLDDPDGDATAFRDELAALVRDSSYPPDEWESQWTTNEWLRGLWFDAFGPEPPPGDPFPVSPDDWGHSRLTPYLLLGVRGDASTSSPGAAAWLDRRGLSFADVEDAKAARRAGAPGLRPEPPGWADHLRQRTAAGARPADPHDDSAPAGDG